MPTCRGCGEEILWIDTPKGKHMPVDPDSFGRHCLTPGVTIVTPEGITLRGGHDPHAVVYGYTSHWATCPMAGEFKRGTQ